MSPCEDIVNTTGKVALFVGIESQNWHTNDFLAAAHFAKQHGISTLIIKVADGGHYWYGGIGNFDKTISTPLKALGIKVIPYSYMYGNKFQSLVQEVGIAVAYLSKYKVMMADIEVEWNGQTEWAKDLVPVISAIPGTFYVSTFANPADQNQVKLMQQLHSCTNAFFPQIYSDHLANIWQGQWQMVGGNICLVPTIDLSGEFGANNVVETVKKIRQTGYPALAIWEYQFAQRDPALLDQCVRTFIGEQPHVQSVALNGRGEVASFVNVTQFLPQHSDFACGPFAVGHVKFAGPPGQGARGTETDVQRWAFNEYIKWIGPDTATDISGSSIDNLHEFLKDANLHWWDIGSISVDSSHNHDIAEIKAALEHGYPVIATVSECSVVDVELGKNPYFWGCGGSHVIVYSGIASDGNLLVEDTANIHGVLHGTNTPLPGPRKYDASRLDNHWATVVKTDWLPPIQSGDPLTWR